MKNIFKLISLLLTVVMILSTLSSLLTIDIFAAEDTTASEGSEEGTEENKSKDPVDHINDHFATPEAKLDTMDLAYEDKNKGVKLYVDASSGEVAYVNTKTGEKLFTNPYDVASSTGNEATKYDILSQIIVTFTDGSGQERIFTSYEQAADRGQIKVENIKNGIRVEYTIGREQSKILVPRLISMERFEEMIMTPLYEIFGDELYNPRSQNTEVFDVQKALSYFIIYSVDELNLSKQDRTNMENTFGGLYDDLKNSDAQYARALKKFPIIDSMPVYVFDPDASEKELTRAEEIITKYCPEYTYEELEYDHILTEYKSDDANPPVFRMALEYKVDSNGLSVRLPANGIRFNESLYTLEHIEILPYMGAGNSAYEGYNFFPDGSGTLFDFQNLNTNQTRAVSGKVYGTDFAYHEVTGTYQKTIRYPVFGVVEEAVYYTYERYDDGELVSKDKIAGNIVEAIKAYKNDESVNFCNGQVENLISKFDTIISAISTDEIKSVEKRGFVCIIEEGDALASLTTYHAGALSDYNTVKMQFTPRPKDSYNISDSISVGANSEWTVVSDRKYVGNYSMKYITLSEANKESEENVYDASWFGMAVAYRDYLTNNGIISKLDEKELTEDIPLYIETFGAIETTEKILSIPVTVMAPLTTFDNVEKMYDELSAQGMKNINFKLTGYANGGMWYTMPGKLKFEKAVGGNDGFQELLDKANDVNKNENSNLGVFPDFDFAYMVSSGLFDGHSALEHNAQTIDGRYASKRVYSATQQKYVNYYDMVISPAYFAEFYEKLTKNYAEKYNGVLGISVSTLGTALNSDFDEDEPYNREDAKEFTVEAFKYFQDNYGEVMTDGGNAYTWKYVDHILGVSLDSSRYNFAAEAVPFIGVVLHGSIRFAGDPLNMEGDLKYAMLKAIENGASPYFILSYQNTQVLKEDSVLSKYYSIRYDIWSDDIYDTYSVLNNVLFDVQDKYITGHQFLTGGTRIPDSDELMTDILLEYEFLLESHRNAAELLEKELERAASIARENGRVAEEYAAEAVIKVITLYENQMKFVNNSAVHTSDFYNNVAEAYAEYRKVIALKGTTDPEEKKAYDRMTAIYDIVQMYNMELAECQSKYDSEFAKYQAKLAGSTNWNHKEALDGIYSDYASEKITKGQLVYNIYRLVAEEQLNAVIAQYKEDKADKATLLAAIEKYGSAFIDASDFDELVLNYLNNNVDGDILVEIAGEWSDVKNDEDDTAQKQAFEAALEKFYSGELTDAEINGVFDAWYESFKADNDAVDAAALEKAVDDYKAGSLNDKKLNAAIGMYAFGKLDKSAILAKLDALKAVKADYDTAWNNYKLDPISDEEFADAEKTYKAAKEKFDNAVMTYLGNKKHSVFKNAVKTYTTAKSAYDISVARKNLDKTDAETKFNAASAVYSPLENAFITSLMSDMDQTELAALATVYRDKAESYNVALAAEDAFSAVLASGFKYSFDECYAVYYNMYSTEIYKNFGKLLKNVDCDPEDREAYYKYYDASTLAKELTSDVDACEIKIGRFDNYLITLAEFNYMKAHRDEVTEEELTRQENFVNQARRNAVTNTAAIGLMLSDDAAAIIGQDELNKLITSTGADKDDAIGSSILEEMKSIYDTAREHVELAEAAIEVLAASENNYQIKYIEGKEEILTNIDTTDPEMPFVVKQAVERAQAAYYYIEEDRFEAIIDGFATEYTHNGNKVYQSVSNSNLYYYGTYEEGYQYLKMVKGADGSVSFDVYDINKSNAGGVANGNIIYENVEEEFGKGVYYTISGGKLTYYTKVSSGIYVERAPIVYGGTLFRTQRDGTEIYKDGDVYYSVNDDGTYTRYNYSQCIRSCYEEIVANVERVIGTVADVQNNEAANDGKILENILGRIDVNERVSNKNDDGDEVEDNEDSKYSTENIVAVTYGNDDGSAYKTIILNYNNYSVKIEYDGIVYTIPAYSFVVHE